MKVFIFVGLFLGFLLLFYRMYRLKVVESVLKRTKLGMEEAARQRLLTSRSNLQKLQKENSLLFRMERELNYSGWKRILKGLTVENWLLFNIVCSVILFLTGLFVIENWIGGVIFVFILFGAEWLLLLYGKAQMLRATNQNLLKFLDFLGNYSLTSGEVTGVFNQVSRYVEEPLKSALDECYYEAQTTGDVGMALLSMTEKVEHPKFKEIVRNIEISIRYCADFTILVNSSRKSVREYLRMGEERKSMVREAIINMLLLLLMSIIVFLAVNKLIETSIWQLLLFTIPGRMALVVIGLIFVLFARQIYKIHR